MQFNLSKETPTFNLSKETSSEKFNVEIKWGKNSIISNRNLDVDLMAKWKTGDSYSKSTCFYNNKTVLNQGIVLSEDDTVGGVGEDMTIDFSKIPKEVSEINCFITFYSNRNDSRHIFDNLSDFTLSVTDVTNNKVLITSKDITPKGVTHEIIKFVKVNNQWEVQLTNNSMGNIAWEVYSKKLSEDNNLPNHNIPNDEPCSLSWWEKLKEFFN